MMRWLDRVVRRLAQWGYMMCVGVCCALIVGMSRAETQQKLQCVPLGDVDVIGGLWRDRRDVAIQKTLPHCLVQCEERGKLRFFEIAAGLSEGRWTTTSTS